jgi:hypothetical protein
MIPVHHLPASQHLYMAFVDRINYSALYAVDKMLECRTEPCLAVQSQVLQALNELRSRPHPVDILVASITDRRDLASTVLAHVLSVGATDVKVSGFDDFIWVRSLSPSGYTDMLFQAQKFQPEIIVPVEAPP